MTIKAVISPRYLLRFGTIALFAIGLAIWSWYDGAIGWPNQRTRALKYIEVKEEARKAEKKQEQWHAEWRAIAQKNNWPEKYPGEPKDEAACQAQFYMAGLAGIVGVLLALRLALLRGRWITSDDTGLSTNRGERVEYAQITALNKKDWRSKGIARVQYMVDDRKKRLVLDDYKYDRSATDMILRVVEANIDHALIVQGKPEPPLTEETPGDEH